MSDARISNFFFYWQKIVMLSFLGRLKDSKKSTPEKEVDGGFVIVGEKHEFM